MYDENSSEQHSRKLSKYLDMRGSRYQNLARVLQGKTEGRITSRNGPALKYCSICPEHSLITVTRRYTEEEEREVQLTHVIINSVCWSVPPCIFLWGRMYLRILILSISWNIVCPHSLSIYRAFHCTHHHKRMETSVSSHVMFKRVKLFFVRF